MNVENLSLSEVRECPLRERRSRSRKDVPSPATTFRNGVPSTARGDPAINLSVRDARLRRSHERCAVPCFGSAGFCPPNRMRYSAGVGPVSHRKSARKNAASSVAGSGHLRFAKPSRRPAEKPTVVRTSDDVVDECQDARRPTTTGATFQTRSTCTGTIRSTPTASCWRRRICAPVREGRTVAREAGHRLRARRLSVVARVHRSRPARLQGRRLLHRQVRGLEEQVEVRRPTWIGPSRDGPVPIVARVGFPNYSNVRGSSREGWALRLFRLRAIAARVLPPRGRETSPATVFVYSTGRRKWPNAQLATWRPCRSATVSANR